MPLRTRTARTLPSRLPWRALVALLALPCAASSARAADPPPNVVVIFIDDLGYADIGPFAATPYPTPNLDRMAAEGRRFTDFVAATAVCSASRAALLTGCLPERVGILGALGPNARHGLHADELTLAELCRQRGYATAIYGKWHLGHHRPFLPLQHGFDEYYGLPYSNDMWPLHPDLVDLPPDAEARKRGYPPLPLYEGDEVVDAEVTAEDQTQLTTSYTRRAVDFIERNASQPFFLYVPHAMVHVPLFVSEKFRGKSGVGLFGDVMLEVDWSVGQILDALQRTGVDERTLVVFTSDNGPWLSYGDHAGSAGDLREGKGTMFEGGYRVPCVMRWPGVIPAGSTCDEFCTTLDLLPTVARLLSVSLPAERPIDGRDIGPLLRGEPGAHSPHEAFPCYYDGQLQAIRDARWKLHFPHAYRTLGGEAGGTGGRPAPYRQARIERALYDLRADPSEQADVLDQHPDVAARLEQAAERYRNELGDRLTERTGSAVRGPGRLEEEPAAP